MKKAHFLLMVVLVICIGSNMAMSSRPKEKLDSTVKKTNPVIADPKSETDMPITYLDSLNRGKEFSLKEIDFIPITTESTSVAPSKDFKEGNTEGYRIQCFASSQIDRIRLEQKNLESRIKFPLYIVFNAPYYKLLAGDFIKRLDADNAAAKLKEMGYGDAWVARSRIEIKH